jgi:hypothetical protein
LRSALLKAILEMNQNPEGRRALAGLRFDKFRTPDTTLYDSVRANVNLFEGAR